MSSVENDLRMRMRMRANRGKYCWINRPIPSGMIKLIAMVVISSKGTTKSPRSKMLRPNVNIHRGIMTGSIYGIRRTFFGYWYCDREWKFECKNCSYRMHSTYWLPSLQWTNPYCHLVIRRKYWTNRRLAKRQWRTSLAAFRPSRETATNPTDNWPAKDTINQISYCS